MFIMMSGVPVILPEAAMRKLSFYRVSRTENC